MNPDPNFQIPNLTIEKMVNKFLKQNDLPMKADKNLSWVKDLLAIISKHYECRNIAISKGTFNSIYGYNVHIYSKSSNGSLYFRVEPEGVEFNNDKIIHTECNEELVKKVIEHCDNYFVMIYYK